MLSNWLSQSQRSISFGMTENQRFSIEGDVTEVDGCEGGPTSWRVNFGGIEGLRVTNSENNNKQRAVFEGEDLINQNIVDLTFAFAKDDNIAENCADDEDDRLSGEIKLFYIVE